MLRRVRLTFLILITMIWFVFILPYLLIQTEWGSLCTGQLISKYTDTYTISIGRISHSFTKPYELTLEDLVITNKQQTTTYISTKKLVIGVKKNDLLQIQSFDYLVIEQGQIELTPTLLAINSDFLQLKNTTLHYLNAARETEITLDNVHGGIKPWSSKFITARQDGQFNFTIGKMRFNHFNINSILIKGIQKDQTLKFTDFGGNINQGFFTVRSEILPDNTIEINQFNIQNINFQSALPVTSFEETLNALPKTTIRLLSITDSSVDIPTLMVEKANLEAKNIIFDDRLQLQYSDLSFNAQSLVWHDEFIESPLIQWHNQDDSIIIEHAMALWNKGKFTLYGTYKDNILTIDNVIGNNLRYQLPTHWYQSLYSYSIPNFLPTNIEIKSFILMPSLIIDTEPSFPFQFSAFEAFGKNIKIHSTNHEMTLNGSIAIKADSGTLNSIELKHPDLLLTLDSNNYKLDFSTLIDDGVVEGHASLLTTQQLPLLILNAHGVKSEVLSLWHLINNPIQSNKFTIKLHGNLIPLSLDGQLQINEILYTIQNNRITSHQ